MTLLCIGVPSYNDAGMLEDTLRDLLPLVAVPDVEILVSDNNSSDMSSDVLRQFALETAGRVRTFVQPTNIGFRANLRFLASKSTSKYIWFLGIGERVDTGSVVSLLEILRSVKPTNLVLAGTVSNKSPKPSATLAVSESRSVGSTPLYSETISLNILNRVEALKSLGRIANSTGDHWPHLEAILGTLERMGPSANTVFVGNPLVSIAHNVDGWWFDKPEAYVLYLAQIRIMRDSVKNGSQSLWLKRRLERMLSRGLGEIVLRSRQNGRVFSREEIRFIQREARLNSLQKLLLKTAHLTPLGVFKFLAPLAKII